MAFVSLNGLVVFRYGAPPGGFPVVFADGVLPGRLDTDKVGRMGMEISTGQDPGTWNGRARLYAHMLPIPMSNRAGLGTLPSTWRKKAS